MSMIAIRFFARRSRMTSRIWAWIVTSSAVVGSSAMSRSGSVESAMAIITRWRMPPESWCGCSLARRLASAMPTTRIISTARSHASRRLTAVCCCTASAIWSPQVKTGLRLVIGSWKIMLTWSPRMSRMSASRLASRFSPLSRISPATMRPGRSMRRITDRLVTLFPQPDSPTTPTVWPWPISNVTSSTALTIAVLGEEVGLEALDLEKRPDVPSASRSLLDPLPRVERVAQPVAEEAGREHDQDQDDPRIERP